MKFIVSSEVLYRNLSAISGVMSSNNSMPILDNVLMSIQENKLVLTASDLESTMTAEIELDNVEGEGAVAIPAKILIETLKLIPPTPIIFVIDEENNVVKFTAANGEYDAPCRDGSEFPKIDAMTDPPKSCQQDALRHGQRRPQTPHDGCALRTFQRKRDLRGHRCP